MKTLITLLFALVFMSASYSQSGESYEKNEQADKILKHSLETSPMSPLFQVYGLLYYNRFSVNDEVILGLNYSNIHYDFGNHSAPGITIGYRRFLWKNLHVQYELWPAYDNFYEKNEDLHYKSFTVWNEFRLGYQFGFNIKNFPCYVSVQWPLGFFLYNGDKPSSYIEYEKEHRFFYQVPVVFIGLKF